MRALITGSFDPITLGHQYIIEQARIKYPDLTVCVMVNDEKTPAFNLEQRRTMIDMVADNKYKTDAHTGWCYEYCRNNGIDVIVRGFRNAEDYAYETEMAIFNKSKCGVATELICADGTRGSISSTEVKQRIKNGLPLEGYLDKRIIEYIASIKDGCKNNIENKRCNEHND